MTSSVYSQFEGLDLHLDGLLSTQKNQLLADNFSSSSTNISKPQVIIGNLHRSDRPTCNCRVCVKDLVFPFCQQGSSMLESPRSPSASSWGLRLGWRWWRLTMVSTFWLAIFSSQSTLFFSSYFPNILLPRAELKRSLLQQNIQKVEEVGEDRIITISFVISFALDFCWTWRRKEKKREKWKSQFRD